MNNKNKLIILLLAFSLLIIGPGSASGLYNDSATVAGQDMTKSSGVRVCPSYRVVNLPGPFQ